MEKWFLIFFRSSSSPSTWCAVSVYNVLRKICEYERNFLTNIDTNVNVRSPHVTKKLNTTQDLPFCGVTLSFQFTLLFGQNSALSNDFVSFFGFIFIIFIKIHAKIREIFGYSLRFKFKDSK